MSRDVITPPESPADFLPPKPSSMIAEMAALLRNPEHYAEVRPYIMSISGHASSINGSPKWDEAACVFHIQGMCRANGYTLLADANAKSISHLFKAAYRRNTGQTFEKLLKQGVQLRLEHKRGFGAAE